MYPIILLVLYLGRVEPCDFGCRAVRFLDTLPAEYIEVADGIRFVRSGGNETGRSDTVLSALKRFFGRYDLSVNLRRFLPPEEEVASGLRTALSYLSDSEGRGNGGKKGNGLLVMASMMGGTVATLGFGALAMLTMKALTVSAMALTLSVIMGLKRLFSKQDYESGHIVSYVPYPHGARRRRRRNLVY